MTEHFKHLLGRWKIHDAEKAIQHARNQQASLVKVKVPLKDNWVEIHIVLYDTEKE